MFVAKCENKTYMDHKLGEKQGILKKLFFGAGLTLIIILCIAGPLLLFSSYNPIAVSNPVSNSDLSINMRIEDETGITSTIRIFSTAQQSELAPLTQEQYDIMNFSANYNSTSQFGV